ncbi:MAG: DNA helicase UvrD [Candidatus Magasanikbacteria bacterium]|nr:DNA helicase UvrD [Candidatus Magasanikbacteria bacterium]
MKQILDLHIHSKYSRACSKHLDFETIAKTCEIRGINIVATGDFTHPKWFASIKEELKEVNPGLYALKNGSSKTRFIIGTEVASIKKHKGKTRRVHLLLFAPTLETAERFNGELMRRGFNVRADGRPILGLTSKELLELMLNVDKRMVMIPAHAWTPWFGIFGSKGGYDSVEEAFDEYSSQVFAIETGLSSDPLMNWRISGLDRLTLISNSDAHSPQKLGREANVMAFDSESEISYDGIMRLIREGDKNKFLYTIEFYPEEGKYHLDGHSACGFVCHPSETKKYAGLCPKCKKPLVIGVMNRVSELADRDEIQAKRSARIPYKSLVPLPEIIADVLGKGVHTKSVQAEYTKLVRGLGSEFFILLEARLEDIALSSSSRIADAVDRARRGDIYIKPGFDGVFGVVKIFADHEKKEEAAQGSFLLD